MQSSVFKQIFTILFVLYRFTAFFTMIYGFIQFCGKCINGIIYIKNQSNYRRNYFNRVYNYFNDDESERSFEENLNTINIELEESTFENRNNESDYIFNV